MSDERVSSLEERMEHMESILDSIDKKIGRIEVGIFGDNEMGYSGLIERVRKLELKVKDIEKVNDQQEVSISAKRHLTDDVVLWGKRAFWILLVITLLVFLFTGKIGIADIFEFM
jgi:hypothetical protein